MSMLSNMLSLRPVLTEKSNALSASGIMTFKVAVGLTKSQIKIILERLFGAEIQSICTANIKGKVKKFKNRVGQRANYKKVFVCLKKGTKIDMNMGIKQ